MDELVDRVDNEDTILGTVLKHEAHLHGWLHRTVIAEVRDRTGNIILVRQADDRQDAGQYVCPVGGHVKAGESNLAALKRETFEEIGLSSFSHRLVDHFIYDRHVIGRHENHLFIIFQLIVDPAEIILGPESVDFRIFSVPELKTAQQRTPEIFGESYLALINHTFPELLP